MVSILIMPSTSTPRSLIQRAKEMLPWRLNSSAEKKTNMSAALCWDALMIRAISRSAATPEALSLAPGASTVPESRGVPMLS